MSDTFGSNELAMTNLRRGTFRVWITLSVAWSLFDFYYALDHASLAYFYKFGLRAIGPTVSLEILLPWLLTAFAILIRWVIRGFRTDR
jgi:hypothetical protein